MPKYVIQKEIEAKSIKDALKKESKAEITYVDKKVVEEQEGVYNTHAIGFSMENEWDDYE